MKIIRKWKIKHLFSKEASRLYICLFGLQYLFWVLFNHLTQINRPQVIDSIGLPYETLPRCHRNFSTLGHIDTAALVKRLIEENLRERQALTLELIKKGMKFGGSTSPLHCKASSKVVIIIPFRGREYQLDIFLRYMHPYLQKQLLEYRIIVIEQTKGLPFNRGSLLNIGFVEAIKIDPSFDCIILHDVDMLPEHEMNDYSCPKEGKPRQLAWIVDIWDYKPVHRGYAGGVTAISTNDFIRVNGFSNQFWGWGVEDEDFFRRMVSQSLQLTRIADNDPTKAKYAKYRTLYHPQARSNEERFRIYNGTGGIEGLVNDGLTTLRYEKKYAQLKLYYAHIVVDLFQDKN